MHRLIRSIFAETFASPDLEAEHDAATLHLPGGRIAYTTDSFVVSPLFFPGGDIGSLAVHGTVNDLAMSGARPLYLSAGFIIEEGLEMEVLWRVANSMRQAADEAGVRIVTGDTKVVERGKGDGIFINTSGIGVIEHDLSIEPMSIRAGDAILVNGDLGRHGMAIMASRNALGFETEIQSDSASLNGLVEQLIQAGLTVHCLRDLTRGGLGSALNEIASTAGATLELQEAAIPVSREVNALAEVLGIDPIHVANEGRMVVFLPEDEAERALDILSKQTHGQGAARIGRVLDLQEGVVTLKSPYGPNRILPMISGEQLPRIC